MRPLDPIKRNKIIRAVFAISGKHGFAGISIIELSKESGVGVGSLYTYFKNKEEVIQAAYLEVEHKMTQEMYAGLKESWAVKASLKHIYLNTVVYRLKHYNETVFIDHYRQSGYVQLNLTRQMKEYELHNKPLYELLKRGQSEKLFAKTDLFILTNFISNSARSCSNVILQKLIPDTKSTTDRYFNMTWKGIGL